MVTELPLGLQTGSRCVISGLKPDNLSHITFSVFLKLFASVLKSKFRIGFPAFLEKLKSSNLGPHIS